MRAFRGVRWHMARDRLGCALVAALTLLLTATCGFQKPAELAPTGGSDAATDAPGGSDTGVGSCDVLAQTGCAAGQKCGWIIDNPTPDPQVGHIGCAPNGPVVLGGVCVYGVGGANATGPSNCAATLECENGTCQQMCGPGGGAPTCASLHACGNFDGLLVGSGGQFDIKAGLCQPTCDLLTQELSGGGASACDSPVPTNPALGCYPEFEPSIGLGFQNGACSRTPESKGISNPATDRVACTVSNGCANPNPFINGCAPGYVPVIFEASGSLTVICSALCAPLETDKTRSSNAAGDATALGKLPTEAVPVAGHATCKAPRAGPEAEDCKFIWLFGIDQTTGSATPSPLNDKLGFCEATSDYQYLGNFGTGSTDATPTPSCAQLLAGSASSATVIAAQTMGACNLSSPDPTMTSCYAVNWGCYTVEDSFAPSSFAAAVRRNGPSMRLPLGGSTMRRRPGGIH